MRPREADAGVTAQLTLLAGGGRESSSAKEDHRQGRPLAEGSTRLEPRFKRQHFHCWRAACCAAAAPPAVARDGSSKRAGDWRAMAARSSEEGLDYGSNEA